MAYNIPVYNSNVNISNLHDVFAARLEAALADPRFFGELSIFSGVRTYEHQKKLYDGYMDRLPGYNLAANPNVLITPRYGLSWGQCKGSWHMEQLRKGYAVDLNFDAFCWKAFGLNPAYSANRLKVSNYIEEIMLEYMLKRTVPSEEWHYQMIYEDWTTKPQTQTDPTPLPEPTPDPISLGEAWFSIQE